MATVIDKQKTYLIGDFARTMGLSQRAVRYYEEIGFIKPSRTNGGFRLYSERDIQLISMVRRFKELGMSLEEIRSFLSSSSDGMSQESMIGLKAALLARRMEFEAKINKCREGIEQLEQALEFLTQCASCGAQSDANSCNTCMKNHGVDASPLINPPLENGTAR